MNGACDKFLARAGLSQQEHGRITRGDRFDELQHLPERQTLAYNSFKPRHSANLFAQTEIFIHSAR
jgi:hypothetical protein